MFAALDFCIRLKYFHEDREKRRTDKWGDCFMNILHTSDWHIGRTLYGRRRYGEFEAFLEWLCETLREEQVDVLLIAGDVFDTTSPGNRAQELYYRFLDRASSGLCRHIVVIAGNHDSPSFLDAPKGILRALNVHVISCANGNGEEEVLTLDGKDGRPGLIVCAVPYLRDRDIRPSEAGENPDDKDRKLLAGIRDHYGRVTAIARKKQEEAGGDIPIVVMGHLFTSGGQTVEGDGVRELYVGSLAHVHADIFGMPDYLALGHLHVPQRIMGSETMRYSGSPLPMGFGEAGQQKSVCLVSFSKNEPQVRPVDIPVFQKLKSIRGSWDRIALEISELSRTGESVWIEVAYEGDEIIGNLRERLDEAVAGTEIEILRIRNNRITAQALSRIGQAETLDNLDELDVFNRCLGIHNIPEEQHPSLIRTYRETLLSIRQDDGRDA